MTPLELIKSGIENGDWKAICEAYRVLTGCTISPSGSSGIIHPKLAKIWAIMNEPDDDTNTSELTVATFSDNIDVTVEPTEQADELVTSDNSCLITNTPTQAEIEENKKLAAKSMQRKTATNRQSKPTTYEVKCSECNKTFLSPIRSGSIGQKCQDCLNDKKGRFVRG